MSSSITTSTLPASPSSRFGPSQLCSRVECLSEEILLEILSYLSISELVAASRISQRFNRLCDEPQLWRRIYCSLFMVERLKHPFLPALDQRLRGSIESRSFGYNLDRKGKKKQLTNSTDDETYLGHTWKTLCRISLNWKRGSAGLTCIAATDPSIVPITSQSLTTTATNRNQESSYHRPNTLVRFHRSLLFIARKSRSLPDSLPTVYVYSLGNHFDDGQQNQSILLGKLTPDSLQSQSSSSILGEGVTEISIDEACEGPGSAVKRANSTVLLSVFYTNGQFAIFEIKLPSTAAISNDPMSLKSQQVGSFQLTLRHKSSSSWKIHHDAVETAKFSFPLIVTCSGDFQLRFFYLSWPTSKFEAKDRLIVAKISLDMQNHSCYWPLSLSLKRTESSKERFKLTIAYPMPFYPSAWTIGLQEFDFEILASKTSSYSLHMHTNRFLTAFQQPSDKARRPMTDLGLTGIVVGIEQAAENVIVGRSDNTIDCFRLNSLSEGSNDEKMKRLTRSNTLFGHTSQIGSISVDENGRCVSGGMDGVKVWEGSEPVDVRPKEPLPTSLGTRRVGWIGLDSEKIVSLWVWEDRDQDGKTARLHEEIRVMSFI